VPEVKLIDEDYELIDVDTNVMLPRTNNIKQNKKYKNIKYDNDYYTISVLSPEQDKFKRIK